MCLGYFNCNCLQFRNQDRTVVSATSLQIFHQNILQKRSKNDELINSLETDSINPHVLYNSKHHMEEQDLLRLTLSGYILGQVSAVKIYRRAVCIFLFVETIISAKLIFHCALKKEFENPYRLNRVLMKLSLGAPTGEFNQFKIIR
jgi:hypothetical protein